MPIHAPKIGGGGISPQNGVQYERDPNRDFLARKHVVGRIDRQNRLTGAGSARAEK